MSEYGGVMVWQGILSCNLYFLREKSEIICPNIRPISPYACIITYSKIRTKIDLNCVVGRRGRGVMVIVRVSYHITCILGNLYRYRKRGSMGKDHWSHSCALLWSAAPNGLRLPWAIILGSDAEVKCSVVLCKTLIK